MSAWGGLATDHCPMRAPGVGKGACSCPFAPLSAGRPLLPPAAAACSSLPTACHCHCPAGGFVIDEDGLGYADVGEEIDWGTAEEEQQEAPGSASKAKGKKGALPPLLPPLPRFWNLQV